MALKTVVGNRLWVFNLITRRNLRLSSSLFCEKNYKYSENKQEKSETFFKNVILFATGFLGYVVCKEKLRFPTVEAATKTNLVGRRDKFNFIADVVDVSAPSVVYIEIKDKRPNFLTGKPLTLSNGSGFIVQEDGLILTNAHVVVNKPNSAVHVRLMDGSTHIATVEHVDERSDLATIRIPVRKLPAMKLGNSKDIRPGEWVVAMGSPLALSNTVTVGVVSSTHRASEELGLAGRDMVYIQTDAPITFGNSGGPLVNLDGEAIGINSMKVTSGISFAIPIDYVRDFLAKSKVAGPPVSKRYLGITMLSLTRNILQELHQRYPEMPTDIQNGILVWKVILGSPAHVGGLLPGDIITSINGVPINSASDVYKILEGEKKSLKMNILRGNKRIEVVVNPEEQ